MANGVTNKDLYEAIEKSNDDIKKELRNYVRIEAFTPIQKLVYGLVGAVGFGVVGSILALVLRGGSI